MWFKSRKKFVQEELDRSQRLLSAAHFDFALHETKPILAPKQIGALAGVGYRTEEPEVIFAVYVFKDWSQHEAAAAQLQSTLPSDDEDLLVRHSTNGPLLFFGYTRISPSGGSKAKYRLADIISAFAGKE